LSQISFTPKTTLFQSEAVRMRTLSLHTTKLETAAYFLCALRVLSITVALMVFLPLHVLWNIIKKPSPWPAVFFRVSATALGIRVTARGKPLRKDVFFVSNHLSWHDIPILAGLTGTTFVAQHGVRKWPVIGWLAKLNRTVFVVRTEKHNIANQVSELRAAIAKNPSVTLFAEGTTSDGQQLLPFKQSLFATLSPPPKSLMVQPVFIDFGKVATEIAWIGDETGWASTWRAFTRRGRYEVAVHFLEPFDPAAMADRKMVCAAARSKIAEAMSSTLGYAVT